MSARECISFQPCASLGAYTLNPEPPLPFRLHGSALPSSKCSARTKPWFTRGFQLRSPGLHGEKPSNRSLSLALPELRALEATTFPHSWPHRAASTVPREVAARRCLLRQPPSHGRHTKGWQPTLQAREGSARTERGKRGTPRK